ncbi:MAG: hypothetical protein D6807_06785 [Alphaproteobacteria bacterium]|nr:MAG: hypothetical protein D6807_06785 [Alphaproteobacteria bacterium]
MQVPPLPTSPDEGHGRWRPVLWGLLVAIAVLPLLAMQVTDEVRWSLSDFLLFAAMLGGAGAFFELAARVSRRTPFRLAAGIAVGTAFLLVWANAAVGLLGPGGAASNLLAYAVPVVMLAGTVLARFRARAMTRVMWWTAATQVLVGLAAFLPAAHATDSPLAWNIAGMTASFVLLWLLAGALFLRAAR